MDLNIKDVSELLSVSEDTIRRWISLGQIPAYWLNRQYWFNRLEIENWMVTRKMPQGEKEEGHVELQGKGGTQHYGLSRAIYNGDVIRDVEGTSKEEIIRNSAELFSGKLGLDGDLVAELLLDRENLMSTALDHGLAVPHPRELIMRGQVDRLIVVFPKHPVDFGALDGRPVEMLFFLFSSQDKRHLHLLAKIAHLSGQEKNRNFLLSRPEKEPLLNFVKSWEENLS